MLEKKLFDIKQMIIIKEQSILALEIIYRNNKDIIRNLQRITNVTIVALNIAVVVANSLYNQKIVLNSIYDLEKGTTNIIKKADRISVEESEFFYTDSLKSEPVETLKSAFNNALETLIKVEEKNKKTFPENEIQILELRKMEGNNG